MIKKKKITSAAIFSRLLVFRLFFPSLVFAALLIVVSGIFMLSSIEREQSRLANSVGKILDEFLKDATITLGNAGDNADFADLTNLNRLLTTSQASNYQISSLFALDPQGILLAISPENPGELMSNHSNDPFFILGKAAKGDIWISQPYQEKETGSLVIYISKGTKTGGLIVGKIYLQNLLQLINVFVDPQVGRTIFVNDKFKNVLTQSDPSETEAQNSSDRHLLTFEDGGSLFMRANNFIIQSVKNISRTDWNVVVQLNPTYVVQYYLGITSLIGIGCLLLWWIILLNIRKDFARHIANPLTELRRYIQNVTESNFSNKTRPVRINAPLSEINDLAASFDQMSLSVYLRQQELKESEKKFRVLIDQSVDAIFMEIDDKLILVNPKFSEIFAYYPDQIEKTPKSIEDFAAESSLPIVRQMITQLKSSETAELRFEFLAVNASGNEIDVEVSTSVFPYQGSLAVQGIMRDITERKRIEREEREQRIMAEALRDTAAALNSTLNLDDVMERILENIRLVVPQESSNIMLVENPPVYANIVAVKGDSTTGMDTWSKNARFPILKTPILAYMYENGLPIVIPDVLIDPTWITISEGDSIRSYMGAPIKLKDQVIGFLNLESPEPGFFNQQQTIRLQAFADQAGIAIQNARLLNELTRTNQDLILAYETTLQGWSKALEIRDYETHGHTLRVLEQTVKLARRIGIPQEDITNLKYGVLLHDIGKLFIPDQILNNDRPLSEDEWLIMRQHPVYAFEILSPISYLGSSIEIPYCHHERWDGGGYPRGLKGTQIPLAARIFTVIDIWDAVTVDRSYREKWSYDEAIEYIKQQSGLILDPMIVEAFIQMKEEEYQKEEKNDD